MTAGITRVILSGMKTAISIPDRLFEAAESLAKSMGLSRSALYVQAVERFVAEQEEGEITARLNEVYGGDDRGELDPGLLALQMASLGEEEAW